MNFSSIADKILKIVFNKNKQQFYKHIVIENYNKFSIKNNKTFQYKFVFISFLLLYILISSLFVFLKGKTTIQKDTQETTIKKGKCILCRKFTVFCKILNNVIH